MAGLGHQSFARIGVPGAAVKVHSRLPNPLPWCDVRVDSVPYTLLNYSLLVIFRALGRCKRDHRAPGIPALPDM